VLCSGGMPSFLTSVWIALEFRISWECTRGLLLLLARRWHQIQSSLRGHQVQVTTQCICLICFLSKMRFFMWHELMTPPSPTLLPPFFIMYLGIPDRANNSSRSHTPSSAPSGG
jgi:hypothetical protein